MISSADVPSCPACGAREVHPVKVLGSPTLYACRGCGRDQTDAWTPLQEEKKPEPKPVIGRPPEDPETIREAAMRLGIAATVRSPS